MGQEKKSLVSVLYCVGAALAAALLLYGCSSGGGGTTSTGTAGSSGLLKVAITDKPRADYAAVVVSIKEVRVVPAGRENAADNDPGLPVVASFSPAWVIDVMQLHFIQMALGEAVLPAGTYSQIRLILEQNPQGPGQEPANYLVLKDDLTTKIPLTTPSAQQSGLKVLGPIEVEPDKTTAVMIDFDPNTAIVARGNGKYNLKPTGIRLVTSPVAGAQYGSISGVVAATDDWSSATVTVKRRGTVNDIEPFAAGSIFSTYTSGSWQAPFALFVPPSPPAITYKTFVSANGFQLYSSSPVAVIENQTTDLGTIPLVSAP